MSVSEHTNPGAAPPPEGPPFHRHHRFRTAAIVVAVLVVVGVGVVVGRYIFRHRPGPKSLDAAVEQFRESSSSTAPETVSFQRPEAGVYRAAGEGTETISTPPNSQSDGAVMPISVKYLPNGCWTWHLDYNSAHWHEFDFCPQGSELLLVAQRNFQSWDFGSFKVDNLGTYTCDPPAPIVVENPQAGQTFDHHCEGDNSAAPGPSTSAGPATIVGPETLTINGAEVAVIHQSRAQRMTGTQNGRIDEDWWFAVDTGLPLRAERHYRIETSSIIGTITYTENGSWQLTSLQPST